MVVPYSFVYTSIYFFSSYSLYLYIYIKTRDVAICKLTVCSWETARWWTTDSPCVPFLSSFSCPLLYSPYGRHSKRQQRPYISTHGDGYRQREMQSIPGIRIYSFFFPIRFSFSILKPQRGGVIRLETFFHIFISVCISKLFFFSLWHLT